MVIELWAMEAFVLCLLFACLFFVASVLFMLEMQDIPHWPLCSFIPRISCLLIILWNVMELYRVRQAYFLFYMNTSCTRPPVAVANSWSIHRRRMPMYAVEPVSTSESVICIRLHIFYAKCELYIFHPIVVEDFWNAQLSNPTRMSCTHNS
jgi:hypothetical protein